MWRPAATTLGAVAKMVSFNPSRLSVPAPELICSRRAPVAAFHVDPNASIEPGGQRNPEINDALYPAGTAWYKIRITGAKASVQ